MTTTTTETGKSSRRGFLGAILAMGAVGVPAAAGGLSELPAGAVLPDGSSDPVFADPDAELHRLISDYYAAEREAKRLGHAFEQFEEKHFAALRHHDDKIPSVLNVRPEDNAIGMPAPRAAGGIPCTRWAHPTNIDRLRPALWPNSKITETETGYVLRTWRETPTPEQRARADELIAAFDRHSSKEPRKPRGYRVAERASKAADKRMYALEDKVWSTPAHTPAGMAAKAGLASKMLGRGLIEAHPEGAIVESLARDAVAIGSAVSA